MDWYERRHELDPGQVFRTNDGSVVKLDRGVPGDGTRWYVQSYCDGRWFCDDNTIEPGDLTQRLPELERAYHGR